MELGFIGLGQMGSGMAASLLRAGHQVTVYNRTAGKTVPLAAAGARVAPSIAALAGQPIVITMLADDHAVEGTVWGEGGLLGALPKGAMHISSSTISVQLSERLHAAHAAAGQSYVSAPVFGRPEAAAAAKLFVIAAGRPADLERAAGVLSALGQRTFVVSEQPHLANLLKLSGNFMIAGVIELIGEAMALADKGGIDRHAYLEVLTATLFGAPVFKTYGGLIAARKFSPAGFAVPLGQKDVRLTLEAAESLSVAMPVASLLRDRFLSLRAHGLDHLDWAALGLLPAIDAGADFPGAPP